MYKCTNIRHSQIFIKTKLLSMRSVPSRQAGIVWKSSWIYYFYVIKHIYLFLFKHIQLYFHNYNMLSVKHISFFLMLSVKHKLFFLMLSVKHKLFFLMLSVKHILFFLMLSVKHFRVFILFIISAFPNHKFWFKQKRIYNSFN